jgi:hypothetical protein
MTRFGRLAAFLLGGIVMTQTLAAQTPNAVTDLRIDPQVRSFLADLNKDSSPFWELPQPKPQETSIMRPAAQVRIKALMEQGFHKPGDVEERLGYYVGQVGR